MKNIRMPTVVGLIKAENVMPQVTSADAGKLATVDSNGKWAAAELEVGQGEVAVDNTLLVSGAAADAKVTGDKVAELKSAIILDPISIALSTFTWEQGEIKTASGANGSSTTKIRTADYYVLPDSAERLTITLLTGYKISIAWYTDAQFMYCTPYSITKTTNYEIPSDAKRIRLILVKEDNTAITPSESNALSSIAYYNSLGNDILFSERGIITLNYAENDGYYGSSGEIKTAGSVYQERYTSRINAFGLDKIQFDFVLGEPSTLGVNFCVWSGDIFTKKEITQYASEIHVVFDIPQNANFVAVYYRSYGSETTASIIGYATENKIINDISVFAEGRSITYDFDYLKPAKISINHRGYHVTAPENTIPAFRLSKRKGFNFIETDVHFTADTNPVPVCIHDDTLNRTCCNADGTAITGTVSVTSSLYSELLQYDACTTLQWDVYKGTKIPTLDEVLTLCKNIGIYIVIELKSTPTIERVNQLISMVKAMGMERSVIWLSGNRDDVAKVVAIDQTAYVAVYENGLSEETARLLATLKTGKNRVMFDCATASATSNVADLCEAYGLDLGIYSPNDEATIKALDKRYEMITSDAIVANELFYNDNIGDPDTGLLS